MKSDLDEQVNRHRRGRTALRLARRAIGPFVLLVLWQIGSSTEDDAEYQDAQKWLQERPGNAKRRLFIAQLHVS